jgi:hypothetical protein
VPKVLWIYNGRSLLYQDQGLGRRCLFRWYSTNAQTYTNPGDEKMHKNTQINKKKRGTSDIGLIKCDDHIKRVSYLLYLDEKKPRGGKRPGSALEI